MNLRKWIKRGVKPRAGSQKVYLRTVYIGGRQFTTHAWINEFIAGCTLEAKRPMVVNGVEIPSHREAVAELEASL